jgi:hypothetical protein
MQLGSSASQTALQIGTVNGGFNFVPMGTTAPLGQQLRISQGSGGSIYLLANNSVTPAVWTFGQSGYPNNITVNGAITATAASTFAGFTSSAGITVSAGGCSITGGGSFSGSYSCSGGNWSYANVLQANAGLTAGAAGTNTGLTVNGQAGITIAAGATVTGFTNNSPLGITNPNGIVGIVNGADPAAGRVGETNSNQMNTAQALTSGTYRNVISINLTPGDWDVTGSAYFSPSSALMTSAMAGISTVSATLPASNPYYYAQWALPTGAATGTMIGSISLAVPEQRLNVSATTPVYLVVSSAFSAGTVSAYGQIKARRVR